MNTIVVIGSGPNGIYCYATLQNRFPSKNILLIEGNTVVGKKYQKVSKPHIPRIPYTFKNCKA